MPGNKLLEITPLALVFPFELDGSASCSLQLCNKTDDHVAVRVKTTSPSKYSVSFNYSILPPRAKCNIVVAVKHPDILCEDKFLVQSVIFKKDRAKVVDELILPVSYVQRMTVTDCKISNTPELALGTRDCADIKSEKPRSQLEGTNNSCCLEKIELVDARTELHKYKKLHEEMLSEIKKLNVTKSSLNAEREQRARYKQDLKAEREFAKQKKWYHKKLNELKDETSKMSKRCQEVEQELFDACIQLKETENSLQAETKKRREREEELANERTKLHNLQISQQEILNEMVGLKEQNAKLHNERDKILKETENSLQAETKKTREREEELANERTKLHNLQISQQEMLNEMVGLKEQNAKLHNERDKIVRNLEEFRLWIEGMVASSKCSVPNFTEFTYSELKEATKDFSDSLKIGEGGYGSVYKAFLRHTTVAIKILRRESRHGERVQSREILSRVRHPNLVMLIGACPEAWALVYEWMPNGSLQDLLRSQKHSNALTWKTRICIASNICSPLIFLHSVKPHGIVHGDLKPANILLDSNYTSKLSDFGICRQLNRTDTRITPHYHTEYPKGTLPYMDPEYFHSGELTPQYDVYSFGIVLLELVTGRGAIGLRKSVEDALQKGQLEKVVDTSAGEWPLDQAKKMLLLGLRCSDPSRKNRLDLVSKVWGEITSLEHVARPC